VIPRVEYVKGRGLVLASEPEVLLIELVAHHCTRSFLHRAGKELANKLNTIRQGEEAAAAAKDRRERRPA